MSGNDWNGLGRDVKDIVENAINTGDFGALNRDLGVTLEMLQEIWQGISESQEQMIIRPVTRMTDATKAPTALMGMIEATGIHPEEYKKQGKNLLFLSIPEK